MPELSFGPCATVFKARRKSDKADLLCVQYNYNHSQRHVSEGFRMETQSMISIQCRLKHPNIEKIVDIFDTKGCHWVFFEAYPCEDLRDKITKSGPFEEKEAAMYVKDIANALQFAHEKKIVHRGLCLDKLYVAADNKTIKICGWRHAFVNSGHQPKVSFAGDVYTMAPEILNETPQGPAIDVWSLGVVTYIMLVGYPPFHSPDGSDKMRFELIKKGKYSMDPKYWDKVSSSAKDFIKKTLVVDPSKRISMSDVSKHPWLQA